MIRYQNNNIKKMYYNGNEIVQAYLNGEKFFEDAIAQIGVAVVENQQAQANVSTNITAGFRPKYVLTYEVQSGLNNLGADVCVDFSVDGGFVGSIYNVCDFEIWSIDGGGQVYNSENKWINHTDIGVTVNPITNGSQADYLMLQSGTGEYSNYKTGIWSVQAGSEGFDMSVSDIGFTPKYIVIHLEDTAEISTADNQTNCYYWVYTADGIINTDGLTLNAIEYFEFWDGGEANTTLSGFGFFPANRYSIGENGFTLNLGNLTAFTNGDTIRWEVWG